MLCGATAKNSDYDRFSRFFSLLLPFLIIYAALIDDRAACFYNKGMEQPVNEELYSETVEPAKRIIRSDVALYVLVVVVVFAAILLVSALIVLLGLPEFVSQLALFAALLVFGWRLYRVRLLSYRYTLTERMLSVDRIVGRKQRPELAVHLSDITHIRPAAQLPQNVPGKRLAVGFMLGSDLAGDGDFVAFDHAFHSHTAVAVMLETVGHDSVRDLVTDFIRVSARHLFTCKKHS